MTKEELQVLYKAKILPESKNPYHFEVADQADLKIEAYNSLCGDKFQLYLETEGELIKKVSFYGFGCAVSKASTSLMARKLEGMQFKEAANLCNAFVSSLKEQQPLQAFEDEELGILNQLMRFDGRIDCIKLGWEAIDKNLK